MKYDPKSIEYKWQTFWKDNSSFVVSRDDKKPKYYVLDMFPYPSGSGLHVGHLVGYTATDVIARYKRAQGFNVLHPMGWDSFGLPAEQYAMRTGTHPALTTEKNIANFSVQLSALGFSYDLTREFATSHPDYYRWTQKLFSLLYRRGLAYMDDVNVNYCPELGTVLSNEEVENGLSVEGGFPVERKILRQWMLKITEYADRLSEDLEDLDWPESVKALQRNWIGKMSGVVIDFQGSGLRLPAFTTRPETIMGVTYIAVSPEYAGMSSLISDVQRESCLEFLERTMKKNERERSQNKDLCEGVFTGTSVRHPITGALIPVWIAEYVLSGCGTGIVMGVPGHDETDFRFATAHEIPVKIVLSFDGKVSQDPYFDEGGYCFNSDFEDFNIDGLEIRNAFDYVVDYLEHKGKGKRKIFYKLRDWLFSRQRYWGEPIPVLHFEDGTHRVLDDDELPLLPPENVDYTPDGSGKGPLAKAEDWVFINDPKTGRPAERETHTMPQWAGSCWYFLRFCDANNEELPWSPDSERYWMPVDLYVGGAEHAVLHLLYARFWHKVFYDMGLVSHKEPFKKLVNQGLVLAPSYRIPGKGYLNPEDVVEKDGEFFSLEGEKLIVRTEKMSKSKLNGSDPMEIVDEYGSDALRMYALFSGPLEKNKTWSNEGVAGCRRFLNRLFQAVTSDKVVSDGEGLKDAHKLVKKISSDLETLSLNTVPSSLMEFLNHFTRYKSFSKEAVEMVLRVAAPFIPHICEELWQFLGNEPGIIKAGWPKYDESLCCDEVCTYVIQVNGKLRERLELGVELSREEVMDRARKAVQKYLEGRILQKEIFVPRKLVNFVVASE